MCEDEKESLGWLDAGDRKEPERATSGPRWKLAESQPTWDLVLRVPSAPAPKPRAKRESRRALALRIRRAVLALESWRIETVGKARVLMAVVGDLEILRTTPDAKLVGMPAENGIDIWTPKGKVLSIWWNEPEAGGALEDELEVVAFVKGTWHAPLLTPSQEGEG